MYSICPLSYCASRNLQFSTSEVDLAKITWDSINRVSTQWHCYTFISKNKKKSVSILQRSKCSSFLCSIKSYFSVSRVCLMFVFVFLLLFVWSLSSHSRIFTRMETSPLPVMGCKFWPMLGTHGHWAVRVLFSPNNYGKWTLKWSDWLFLIIYY